MENKVKFWLNSENVKEADKEIIKSLDKKELFDAFYKDVEFGTAGMRGVMGVGTNRINEYTIKRASFAYAKFIVENQKSQKVAIAYDNRNNSQHFANVAAQVLSSFNIEVLLFKELMATPLLSYAVRKLNCGGGIVITASHNPKEYNGFKVYDQYGCQLIPELIDKVIENVNNLDDYLDIDIKPNDKLIKFVDDALMNQYYQEVLKDRLINDNEDFSLVFSPQHGTGINSVPKLLQLANYKYHLVESQSIVDGDFSNTLSPNPEDIKAYSEGLKIAKEKNANIMVTTDPDADRVGVAVLHNDEYKLLNGNETTVLILNYLLKQFKENNWLNKDSYIVNTVVTSDLGEKIADDYNVKTYKTLTGFKYIGNLMEQGNNIDNYVYGYEESYGSLVVPIVRDKDAVSATLIISEMAAVYAKDNLTLIDVLEEIYQEYGYFYDTQSNITLEGASGDEKIQEIMADFSTVTLEENAHYTIEKIENFNTLEKIDENGTSKLDFEASDVIKIYFKGVGWIAIRPSGTEPKIKFYFSSFGDSKEASRKAYRVLKEFVNNKVKL